MKLSKSIMAIVVAGLSLQAQSIMAKERINCPIKITANDQMQFSTKELIVEKKCDDVTLTLEHVGKLPKMAMGHNWVLTTEEDMAKVAAEGAAAGVNNDYVKKGDKRVLAATALIGGADKPVSVKFAVENLPKDKKLVFFCSFPGHSAIMKGELKLAK